MRAHDEQRRPVWDRAAFLRELTDDAPELEFAAAVELADRFERAVLEARGSSARFERSVRLILP
jgi:hypothetical protein